MLANRGTKQSQLQPQHLYTNSDQCKPTYLALLHPRPKVLANRGTRQSQLQPQHSYTNSDQIKPA